MSHVVMREGIDVIVAEQFVRPRMETALDMLRDAARMHAPETRVWVTARDERVRRSHVDTDGQVIPANLRFRVPKVNTGDDANDVRAGVDMARHPRDPSLPIGNRINCRCADPTVPHLLRQSIKSTPVTVSGTHVSGSIETRFPRAAESEFGTSEDEAAHFMTQALQEVAARLQAGHQR